MAENLYFMGNGYSALTKLTGSISTNFGAPPTSGTAGAWHTLLQLATPSSSYRQFTVVEYGVSLSGSPAGAQVLLAVTNTSTGPTSAAVAGIITPYTNPGAPTSVAPSSTSASLYTTAQTTALTGTVQQLFDQQLLTTNTYVKQFPLAREPVFGASATQEFLNLAVMVPTTAVTAFCYIVWRE